LTGYICNEPLLLQPSYLEQLSAAGIPWVFSGARASAAYVLKDASVQSPVLIAMEDALESLTLLVFWQRFVNSNSDFL